jgi:hypothetical protein
VVDNYATHKHPTVKAWLAAHPSGLPSFRSDIGRHERIKRLVAG